MIRYAPDSGSDIPKPVPPAPSWLREGLGENRPDWEVSLERGESHVHDSFAPVDERQSKSLLPPMGYIPEAVHPDPHDGVNVTPPPSDMGYAAAGPVDDQYGQGGYYDPAVAGVEQHQQTDYDSYRAASSVANPVPNPDQLFDDGMTTPLGLRAARRADNLLYMGHLPFVEPGDIPPPPPGSGYVEDEYITPPPMQSNTLVNVNRFGTGEGEPSRASRLVRLPGSTDSPTKPTLQDNFVTPGITSQPEQNSDPKYQQLGLSAVDRRDQPILAPSTPAVISVGAGVRADGLGAAEGFRAPSVADLGRIPPPGAPPSDFPSTLGAALPAAGTLSPYAGQALGEKRSPAVDKDGRPVYVPELPVEKEDPGAYGRRVAGTVWILFAILSGLAIALLMKQVSVAGSAVTPMILVGLMMITGKRWAGMLGMLAAVVYTAALFGVGHMLLNGDEDFLQKMGIANTPPELFGYLFYGVAAAYLLANLLMLIGAPGVLRSILGAALMILPQIAATSTMALSEVRPLVMSPTGVSTPAEVQVDAEGLSFVKPDGWNTYSWADIMKSAPIAHGLVTQPRVFFLNAKQDLMYAVYLDDSASAGLAQLFSVDRLTPLEKEITRDLPPADVNGETFELQEKTFLENTYAGTTQAGDKLSIIVNKTQLNGRMLMIVMMRDARANASAESASRALDAFYQSLKFTDKKADEAP